MIHPNKNDAATVTLTAYDSRGEKVDLQTIHGNLAPEIQYLEFADKARRELKAIRITMEVAYVLACMFLVGCIFLSSIVPVAAQTLWCASNTAFTNPQCGHQRMAEPVPYPDLDISSMLEGWHDAMLLVVLKEDRPVSGLNDNWWDLLNHTGLAMIFAGLWVFILGVCWWVDCRKIYGKYVNYRDNE